MRTLALTAALIAATLPTAVIAADWVFVTGTRDFDDYIDRGSIRDMPNGNKRAWVLRLFDDPDERGNTSVRVLEEFDCREGRSRMLQLVYYRDEAVTTSDNTTSGWVYVPPNTVIEDQLNYVCFGKLPG